MRSGFVSAVIVGLAAMATGCASVTPPPAPPPAGWLSWRGPAQNGLAPGPGLPVSCTTSATDLLWSIDLAGRGTPVIVNRGADSRLYAFGYTGEGPDQREVLACLDPDTGQILWRHFFNDFLSDTVYSRYSIASPTVDPETGRVYIVSVSGIFACFDQDGRKVFEHSLMEEFGRMTFPNARNGAVAIDADLAVIHCVTSNWGLDGAASDRLYAFDKKTGKLVWTSTPGVAPRDNSFSMPVFAWWDGMRVLYVGTGCGHVAAINARTGRPIWRYRISQGGVNPSVVISYNNTLIAVHGYENVDTSETGQMYAISLEKAFAAADKASDAALKAGQPVPSPVVLDKSVELWRAKIGSVSSSPVPVGKILYQTDMLGELNAVEMNTGRIAWKLKLGPSQLHASPLYGDGRLYVPMSSRGPDGPFHDANFYVIQPSQSEAGILSGADLPGECLGAPAVWNGRIYLFTTEKLFCFGARNPSEPYRSPWPAQPSIQSVQGKSASLQVVPSEVLLRAGEKTDFITRTIDAQGMIVDESVEKLSWKKYIPPTARVKSEMDADFNDAGELVAKPDAKISAGAFEASDGSLTGHIRGRLLPDLPYREDFESFKIETPHDSDKDDAGNPLKFAYPPLPWIGARFRWEVRDVAGSRALVKTTDNVLFQRAFTFIGHPDMSRYTVEADVMSDGNRRNMSDVGVINQRYVINLVGNAQRLEVFSNRERLTAGVPFKWLPNTWYRIKSRVDTFSDGSGVVSAKAWKKGDPEPPAWTLQVPVNHANMNGSPGLYGFALQSQFRVYLDNIAVTPNKD